MVDLKQKKEDRKKDVYNGKTGNFYVFYWCIRH